MQIKTADGEKDVASKGLGGTALGLAIPGTLAFLNQMNGGCNGILGGLFGGNCSSEAVAGHDTRVISALEAQIAKLESERYTDSVGLELYKQTVAENKAQTEKTNSNFNILYTFAADIDKRFAVAEAVNVERLRCQNERIAALEALTKTVIPASSICPEVMPRYNSWTAPTTTTPTA